MSENQAEKQSAGRSFKWVKQSCRQTLGPSLTQRCDPVFQLLVSWCPDCLTAADLFLPVNPPKRSDLSGRRSVTAASITEQVNANKPLFLFLFLLSHQPARLKLHWTKSHNYFHVHIWHCCSVIWGNTTTLKATPTHMHGTYIFDL